MNAPQRRADAVRILTAAFVALAAACGGDEGAGSRTAPAPAPRSAATQPVRKAAPPLAPPAPPGPVWLLNPTLAVQREGGIELAPMELRAADAAAQRALGLAPRPGVETVRTIGGGAHFLLHVHGFGAEPAARPPHLEREWPDATLVEVPIQVQHRNFDEPVPWTLAVPMGVSSMDLRKLTWKPAFKVPPHDALDDDLRWSLLSQARFDLEDRMAFRPAAYATLDRVTQPRFGPLLLAWLMGRGHPVDGQDWPQRTLRVLRRFLPAMGRAPLDEACSLLEAEEAEKKRHDERRRGRLAACYAIAGAPEAAGAPAPDAPHARADWWRGFEGAPRAAVWAVAAPRWSAMEAEEAEVLTKTLCYEREVSSDEERARWIEGAARRPALAERVQFELQRQLREQAGECAPDAARATMEYLLPTLTNDRFPTAYLWQAGPRLWPVVWELWPRLSEPTRAAAVKEALALEAAPDVAVGPNAADRRPWFDRAMADGGTVLEAALDAAVARPDRLDADLRAALRARAAQQDVRAALRRKVEQALGEGE